MLRQQFVELGRLLVRLMSAGRDCRRGGNTRAGEAEEEERRRERD